MRYSSCALSQVLGLYKLKNHASFASIFDIVDRAKTRAFGMPPLRIYSYIKKMSGRLR